MNIKLNIKSLSIIDEAKEDDWEPLFKKHIRADYVDQLLNWLNKSGPDGVSHRSRRLKYVPWVFRQMKKLPDIPKADAPMPPKNWDLWPDSDQQAEFESRAQNAFYDLLNLVLDFDRNIKVMKNKDINQYKSPDMLDDAIKRDIEAAKQAKISRRKKKYSQIPTGGDVVKLDSPPNLSIVRPKTVEGSCRFGSKGDWCIARTGNKWFDQYLKQGKNFYFVRDHTRDDDDKFSNIAIQVADNENPTSEENYVVEGFWDRYDNFHRFQAGFFDAFDFNDIFEAYGESEVRFIFDSIKKDWLENPELAEGRGVKQFIKDVTNGEYNEYERDSDYPVVTYYARRITTSASHFSVGFSVYFRLPVTDLGWNIDGDPANPVFDQQVVRFEEWARDALEQSMVEEEVEKFWADAIEESLELSDAEDLVKFRNMPRVELLLAGNADDIVITLQGRLRFPSAEKMSAPRAIELGKDVIEQINYAFGNRSQHNLGNKRRKQTFVYLQNKLKQIPDSTVDKMFSEGESTDKSNKILPEKKMTKKQNEEMSQDEFKKLLKIKISSIGDDEDDMLLDEAKEDDLLEKYRGKIQKQALEGMIDLLTYTPEVRKEQLKYLPWVLKWMAKDPIFDPREPFAVDELNTLHDMILEFNKNRDVMKKKDINQYKGFDDLKFSIEQDVYERRAEKSAPKFAGKPRENAEVYSDDRFGENIGNLPWPYTLVRPHTMESSCTFGKGGDWCISQPGNTYYDDYTKDEMKIFFFLEDHTKKLGDEFRKVAIQVDGSEPGGELDIEGFWDRYDNWYEDFGLDELKERYNKEVIKQVIKIIEKSVEETPAEQSKLYDLEERMRSGAFNSENCEFYGEVDDQGDGRKYLIPYGSCWFDLPLPIREDADDNFNHDDDDIFDDLKEFVLENMQDGSIDALGILPRNIDELDYKYIQEGDRWYVHYIINFSVEARFEDHDSVEYAMEDVRDQWRDMDDVKGFAKEVMQLILAYGSEELKNLFSAEGIGETIKVANQLLSQLEHFSVEEWSPDEPMDGFEIQKTYIDVGVDTKQMKRFLNSIIPSDVGDRSYETLRRAKLEVAKRVNSYKQLMNRESIEAELMKATYDFQAEIYQQAYRQVPLDFGDGIDYSGREETIKKGLVPFVRSLELYFRFPPWSLVLEKGVRPITIDISFKVNPNNMAMIPLTVEFVSFFDKNWPKIFNKFRKNMIGKFQASFNDAFKIERESPTNDVTADRIFQEKKKKRTRIKIRVR